MSTSRAPHRIRLELLDGDGCLYNSTYHGYINAFCLSYYHLKKQSGETRPTDGEVNKIIFDLKAKGKMPESFFQKAENDLDAVAEHNKVDPDDFRDVIANEIHAYWPQVSQEILILSNGELFNALLASKEDFDEVVLGVGTLRQTEEVNTVNCKLNGTGCFYRDLKFLETHIAKLLPTIPVRTCKVTLPDLLLSLQAGTNFTNIYEKKKTERIFLPCDGTKLSIIYMVLHQLAGERPDALIDAHFRDDKLEILSAAHGTSKLTPEIFPKNSRLTYCQYLGTIENIGMVLGAGIIDEELSANVRLMYRMCGLLERDGDVAAKLDVATFLKERKIKVITPQTIATSEQSLWYQPAINKMTQLLAGMNCFSVGAGESVSAMASKKK